MLCATSDSVARQWSRGMHARLHDMSTVAALTRSTIGIGVAAYGPFVLLKSGAGHVKIKLLKSGAGHVFSVHDEVTRS